MVKKFLLAVALILGLIYGSGSDLASVKRSVLGASNDTARGATAGESGGWGNDSGY